ncbi:MAG: pentapeptide repeat-containing protein [Myxococcales bacterium]|nr:pentapeptide repeat-containing protein [Myxococcales bacterium]
MKRTWQTMGPILFAATLLQGCIVLPWGTDVTRTVYPFPDQNCYARQCTPNSTGTVEPQDNTTPQNNSNTGSGSTGSGNTGSGNTGSGNTGSGNTGSGSTDPQPQPASSVTLQRLVVEELTGNGTPDEMYYIQREMNGLIESFNACDVSKDEFPVGESLVRFRLNISVGPDGRFLDAEEVEILTDFGKNLSQCVREQLLSSQISLPPRSYVALKLQVRAIVQGD